MQRVNETWYSYSRKREDDPKELFKWVTDKLLALKINKGVIIPANWGDIAKVVLNEEQGQEDNR